VTRNGTVRNCGSCGRRLAQDNRDDICSLCQRKEAEGTARAPDVPAGFWAGEDMQRALDTWHMGKVIAAYRVHPFHRRPLSQEVVAGWVGISQVQLSRIENGGPIRDLDRLEMWARTLQIPETLLWFRLSRSPASQLVERASVQPLQPDFSVPADNDELAGHGEAQPPTELYHMSRRAVLRDALGSLAVPTLSVDDLRHIAAAITNASRYLDAEAVSHFRSVLQECTVDDGVLGARRVIPTVLGVLAAVDGAARDARSAIRLELLKVGAEAAEFAGFLYRDLGVPDVAEYWRDRSIEWARDRDDRQMEGYVLLRKSQAAWDDRDARRMLALADAVYGRRRDLPLRVQAEVAQQQARALAMLATEPAEVERRLDLARDLFGEDDEKTGLGSHYREPLLQAQAALCLTELGQATRAVELLVPALASGTFSYRDYGYFTSQLALAHAAEGDTDQAATVALQAIPIARTTNSVRTQRELLRLVRRLDHAPGEAVEELRHQVAVGF